MEFVFAGLVTLSILMVFTAITFGRAKPSHVKTVVQQYAEPRMLEEMELALPFSTRVIFPVAKAMARILGRFTPKRFVEESRHKLMLPGNPYGWSPVELLGIRGLVAIVGAAILAGLFLLLGSPMLSIILFAAIGATLGFYVPMFWLNFKVRARQDEIQRTLPDAIDLLTICVEVGLSLDAAITKVAEKWDNEISRASTANAILARHERAAHSQNYFAGGREHCRIGRPYREWNGNAQCRRQREWFARASGSNRQISDPTQTR